MSLSPTALLGTPLGDVRIVRLLGKGKAGYSYLARLGDRDVVVKRMHDEPCAYYTFGDNKVRLELRAYEALRAAGLEVPRLLTADIEGGYLVKEYIDGTVADVWSPGSPQALEGIVGELFALSFRLRDAGLNIDYFPANFVVNDDGVHYIDYEVNPYLEQWSFQRWGVYYWANRSGMAAYARTGDWRHINQSADSGVPITAPFEDQVSAWRLRFAGGHGAA